jgi:hypothetical protein
MEELPPPPTLPTQHHLTSDQRSVDRETILSEEIYFDYEHNQHAELLTDLEVEVDVEGQLAQEYLEEANHHDVLTTIEHHLDIDTVSELSCAVQTQEGAPSPTRILTAKNLAKMHDQQGTPVTLQMDPYDDLYPELDEIKVTAFNSEGLKGVDSKPRRKKGCFFLVFLLVVVVAISLGIVISQGRSTERTVDANQLNNPPSSQPVVFESPSASPTEESTAITLAPSSDESTIAPTFSPSMNTSSPDNSTLAPTMQPSLSSNATANATSIPETVAPTDRPSAMATLAPTTQPTDQSTPLPTQAPTTIAPTLKPTSSPTSFPSVTPTDAETQEDLSTESPTPDPTDSPTPEPSTMGCLTQIATSQACYTQGDPIEVYFTNCDPAPSDWIGIYRNPDELDPTNLDDPRLWVYACGSRDCSDQAFSNRIIFAVDWLPAGTYGTFLTRDADSAPYTVFASHTFEISDSCSEN